MQPAALGVHPDAETLDRHQASLLAAVKCMQATRTALCRGRSRHYCSARMHVMCRVSARAGFLYPPGDYGAATAYVRKLVEDATLRAQMGREARLEVCRHTNRYVCLLTAALDHRGLVHWMLLARWRS